MIKVLGYILLFYILYKIIFDFILPVSKATSQVKDKIREMQHAQEEQVKHQQQQAANREEQQKQSTAAKGGDYIEFEEIK